MLFKTDKIKKIARHLFLVLKDLIRQADECIFNLNLLDESEKNKLLNKWSQPSYAFEIPKIETCIHDQFHQKATALPNHIAIQHNDRTVTYCQLNQMTEDIFIGMHALGIKNGDAVCVLMKRTPALIAAMLA